MKRIFLLAAIMILLLAAGPSSGRFLAPKIPTATRERGISGVYVNSGIGAVLTVKAAGKSRYTMVLESRNKECGFDTMAELKRLEGLGFNLALADSNYQASIMSENVIQIEVRHGKNQCREHVEGDYVKR